jgi:hypothetical protein
MMTTLKLFKKLEEKWEAKITKLEKNGRTIAGRKQAKPRLIFSRLLQSTLKGPHTE